MANEYGYETNGSVMGGLGQLLSMFHDNQQRQQQQAAVPFLNKALSQYLGGNQLPNFAALAPFVEATRGLSEGGVNTARAGELGAETNRLTQMLPGELTAQGLNNTFNQDTLLDREKNVGYEGQRMQGEAALSNSEAANNQERQPYIGPLSLGEVLKNSAETGETNARTNMYNTQTGLLGPEFDLKKQGLVFDMSPNSPKNMLDTAETNLANSRAHNFDAETSMYGNQQGPAQGGDPRLKAFADALAQHMGSTGQSQQDTGNPYVTRPTALGSGLSMDVLQSLIAPPKSSMQYLQEGDIEGYKQAAAREAAQNQQINIGQ